MRREEEEETRGGWNQKGKRRRWKPKFFWNGVEGLPEYPDGEGHHEREASEKFKKGKRSAR